MIEAQVHGGLESPGVGFGLHGRGEVHWTVIRGMTFNDLAGNKPLKPRSCQVSALDCDRKSSLDRPKT